MKSEAGEPVGQRATAGAILSRAARGATSSPVAFDSSIIIFGPNASVCVHGKLPSLFRCSCSERERSAKTQDKIHAFGAVTERVFINSGRNCLFGANFSSRLPFVPRVDHSRPLSSHFTSNGGNRCGLRRGKTLTGPVKVGANRAANITIKTLRLIYGRSRRHIFDMNLWFARPEFGRSFDRGFDRSETLSMVGRAMFPSFRMRCLHIYLAAN